MTRVLCVLPLLSVLLCQATAQNATEMNTTVTSAPSTAPPSTTSAATTAKADPTPIPAYCANHSFLSINDCCRNLPLDFFSQDSRWQCYGGLEGQHASQATRNFILNRWLNSSTMNFSLDNPKLQGFLEHMKCYSDCLFRNNNFITATNQLKVDRISVRFMEATPDASRPNVVDAVNLCKQIVPSFLPSREEKSTCPPHAFLFMQCFRKEIMMSCSLPPKTQQISNRVASKYEDSRRRYANACEARMKVLKACDFMKSPAKK